MTHRLRESSARSLHRDETRLDRTLLDRAREVREIAIDQRTEDLPISIETIFNVAHDPEEASALRHRQVTALARIVRHAVENQRI